MVRSYIPSFATGARLVAPTLRLRDDMVSTGCHRKKGLPVRHSVSALLLAGFAGMAMPGAAQSPAKPLHVFQNLALSPAGDRIVTIEGEEAPAPAAPPASSRAD